MSLLYLEFQISFSIHFWNVTLDKFILVLFLNFFYLKYVHDNGGLLIPCFEDPK